jgi:hypothetical protein
MRLKVRVNKQAKVTEKPSFLVERAYPLSRKKPGFSEGAN